MPSIEIRNVVKRFGAETVLHGVDVTIGDGEFVVLVGPSGCGKSTLLRMIAGLETVTGGEIRIDDEIINDVAPQKRDVAMVFQTYALYPHMNVEDNILFALKMRRESAESRRSKLGEVAQTLGLERLLKRLPKQLSGGQRQRVAMGRAIVRDPRAFLFDEPLSNLDAKLRTHMRTEIRELHQRLEATSVYVTHDQIEAMTMADRIVVMNSGRIEQVGTPLELYDRPANRFVAGFLGSPTMNFLSGKVEQADGGPVLALESGDKVPLSTADGDTISPGEEIDYGIRPQHVSISPERIEGRPEGRVRVVEQTGSETIMVVDAMGMDLLVQSSTRQLLKPSDKVSVTLDSEAGHLFLAAGGARLN